MLKGAVVGGTCCSGNPEWGSSVGPRGRTVPRDVSSFPLCLPPQFFLGFHCWTPDAGLAGCLLIQHGCSCSGNSASLQEISFLTELPRQGEAIAFKEINKAGGFRKMGAMKNQFHVLENPEENSFEKQKWWRKLCWIVTFFLLDGLESSWSLSRLNRGTMSTWQNWVLKKCPGLAFLSNLWFQASEMCFLSEFLGGFYPQYFVQTLQSPHSKL